MILLSFDPSRARCQAAAAALSGFCQSNSAVMTPSVGTDMARSVHGDLSLLWHTLVRYYCQHPFVSKCLGGLLVPGRISIARVRPGRSNKRRFIMTSNTYLWKNNFGFCFLDSPNVEYLLQWPDKLFEALLGLRWIKEKDNVDPQTTLLDIIVKDRTLRLGVHIIIHKYYGSILWCSALFPILISYVEPRVTIPDRILSDTTSTDAIFHKPEGPLCM